DGAHRHPSSAEDLPRPGERRRSPRGKGSPGANPTPPKDLAYSSLQWNVKRRGVLSSVVRTAAHTPTFGRTHHKKHKRHRSTTKPVPEAADLTWTCRCALRGTTVRTLHTPDDRSS